MCHDMGLQFRWQGVCYGNQDQSRTSTETFVVVFVEAALRGVPSIGMNIDGLPVPILDEENDPLVPPEDPNALAAAILCLRDDATLRSEAVCRCAHGANRNSHGRPLRVRLLGTISRPANLGPLPRHAWHVGKSCHRA